MLSASEVAPYGPLSSCVPTIGAGESVGCGRRVPSRSAGRSPAPTGGRTAGAVPAGKKRTARALAAPVTLLFFSRPYTLIPYSPFTPKSREVSRYEFDQTPYFG